MRNLVSLTAAAVLLAAIPCAANADTVTLSAAGDTYVRSDLPTTNFESTSPDPLHVDGSPVRRTLLYFRNTPASGVVSAKLRVHVRFHTGEPFEVHASTCQGWSESTVTYNTAPPAGELLATYADDPVGYQEVQIPASKIVPSPEGGFCLQLTKTGVNWMTLSSRESANPPQLVVETQFTPPSPPADTDGDGVPDTADLCPGTPAGTTVDASGCPVVTPPASPVVSCGGTPVSATPSTIASVISSRNSVTINAQPGTYSSLSMRKSSADSCVEIHCTASAKGASYPSWNSGGCLTSGQTTIESIHNLIIDGFVIHNSGAESYGISLYDESPDVNMRVRISNSVFAGSNDHDISTKERVEYAEVVNNWFANCRRHCWEIGQNGNIATRPSTTGTAVFRDNTVTSAINGLTQRYNLTLRVENNDFRNIAGNTINTWPYWTLYPFGSSGDNGALYVPGTQRTSDPKVPLRTIIRNNKFSGKAALRFTGRGVIDDTVLIQGNTGTITSCVRGTMDSQNSGTSTAHANEQTTAPPKLDPASDQSCP